MKQNIYFHLWSCLLLTSSAAIFTSCDKGNVLTESAVKSAVKEVIEPYEQHYTPTSIQLGFYELNSESERNDLRKLAAAGMITYEAQIVIEKIQRYYSVREKEHVFVNVALTPEGQKMVMSEEEVLAYKKATKEAQKGSDKDLECPNIDTEYPEDNIGPEIITKIIRDDGTTNPNSYTPNNRGTETDNDATSGATSNPQKMEEPTTAYGKTVKRISTETVYVKAFKMQIYKIRHVLCPPAMAETGKGSAEVIIEYKDVTPFGRILKHALDGQKEVNTWDFIYYNDQGWTIDKD